MAAKGANESKLARLHEMQTEVFTRSLDIVLEGMNSEDVEIRMMAVAALKPQLLAAVNSFLSNNQITCTPDQLDGLTAAARRIKERTAALPAMPDLSEIEAQYTGAQ